MISEGGKGRAGAVGGGHALREGQTVTGESLLVRYVNFVRLPHTVFALPFSLLGVVIASRNYPVTWRMLGLVVVAFTAARFVAMGFNRIADRDLDARNPRTRSRELPAGRLTLAQAWIAVLVAVGVFEWAAWALNPICFRLSPIVLVVVTLYSYSKRFTWWSHLWLGFGDAMAGPAGYLAISGQWTDPWWLLWVMAAAVTFWIGGFDIFYALQDEAFDRTERLHSAVVRFGQAGGIFVGKSLHGLTVLALVALGAGFGLGVAYYVGVALGAAIMAYEHHLVKPGDLSRLDAAFFGANGIISVVVFLGALVDRIL
ncbi:MAG TPA: 4-hydroxybenzoate octaprenyltransferase [Gemmatimonadales bacterium]|nr:4-hydroxybenzoate octaprenyltransferase [Gemmatimonadales bacterium]